MPKRRVSEHLWTVKMQKCPKQAINLQRSVFVIFFDESQRKSAQKALL